MIGDEIQRLFTPQCVLRHLAELQLQTLGEVARRHTCWIELLDSLEHRDDLVELDEGLGVRCFRGGFIETLGDVFGGKCQHSIGIDGIDDRRRYQPIQIRHRRKIQLPQEMILQRFRRWIALFEVPIGVVSGTAGRCRHRLIDIVPARIDRQFFGNRFFGL